MTFTDCEEVPLNTAGWHIWLILRAEQEADITQAFKVRLIVPDDATSALGVAVLTVHSPDTASLTAGKYYYEFKRVLPGVQPPDVWTFKYSARPEFLVVEATIVFDVTE